MKLNIIKALLGPVLIICLASCVSTQPGISRILPAFMGNFEDDYGIRYNISDKIFLQEPGIRYHILRWNTWDKYIIAKNDEANPSESGLYTRIDYMEFENMAPYSWGFCLTAYKARSAKEAERTAAADRNDPKKGCGGFPFSRFKRI